MRKVQRREQSSRQEYSRWPGENLDWCRSVNQVIHCRSKVRYRRRCCHVLTDERGRCELRGFSNISDTPRLTLSGIVRNLTTGTALGHFDQLGQLFDQDVHDA